MGVPDADAGTAVAPRRRMPARARPDAASASCARGRASGPAPLEIDAAMVEEWLVHFIRDEMGRRGFRKAVVGVSGGVDSAVTAYPRGARARPGERDRRAHAVSHVEPGEPRRTPSS